MERCFLEMKISTLKSLPFLELKGHFWELLHTFLQVLQKDNLAQKYMLQPKQRNFKIAFYTR